MEMNSYKMSESPKQKTEERKSTRPLQGQSEAMPYKPLVVVSAVQTFQLMKSLCIQKLAALMHVSQKRISNAFHRYLYRKKAKSGLYYVTIYWTGKDLPETKVEIYGTFTTPPWKKTYKMKYSACFQAFTKVLCLKAGTQFKFIVNGRHEVSFEYPIVYDDQGFQNNLFKLHVKSSDNVSQRFRIIPDQSIKLEKAMPIIENGPPRILPLLKQNVEEFNSLNSQNEADSKDESEKSEGGKSNTTTDLDILNRDLEADSDNAILNSIISGQEESISIDRKLVKMEKKRKVRVNTATKTTTVSLKFSSSYLSETILEYFFNGTAKVIKKDSGPCEDAFFIQNVAVGVSDGVGGWSDYGVISSDFSEALMGGCNSLIKSIIRKECTSGQDSYEADSSVQDSVLFGIDEGSSSSRDLEEIEDQFFVRKSTGQCIIDPSVVIGKAYKQVSAVGSATAVVCVLNARELTCANIGDSGFLLIRFADCNSPFVLLQSEPQQHTFNTPYQLTKLPSSAQIEQNLRRKGSSPEQVARILSQFGKQEFCRDAPETAHLYQTTIQEGDLLIVATDGVLDNLFPEEMLAAIQAAVKGRAHGAVPPQEIASEIATRAYKKSKSLSEKSPFSEALSKTHGLRVLVRFGKCNCGNRVGRRTILQS